jgi:hypothetical protein
MTVGGDDDDEAVGVVELVRVDPGSGRMGGRTEG